MDKIRIILIAATILLCPPARAADTPPEQPAPEQTTEQKPETPAFLPEYCEFTVDLPEQPLVSHECEDAEKKRCYDLISYTKVFNLASTVQVQIICNPSSDELFAQFTPEVMQTTIRGMTKDTIIKTYDTTQREEKEYRQAGLVGSGRSGMEESIFIAQLWSGKKSIMSVRAELMGNPSDEADKLFADILKSVGYTKDQKTLETEQQPAATQKK